MNSANVLKNWFIYEDTLANDILNQSDTECTVCMIRMHVLNVHRIWLQQQTDKPTDRVTLNPQTIYVTAVHVTDDHMTRG